MQGLCILSQGSRHILPRNLFRLCPNSGCCQRIIALPGATILIPDGEFVFSKLLSVINQCSRIAKIVGTVLLRRHGRRNHLRQLHRLAFGFEFGNVRFDRKPQLIMADDRNENRHGEDNANDD